MDTSSISAPLPPTGPIPVWILFADYISVARWGDMLQSYYLYRCKRARKAMAVLLHPSQILNLTYPKVHNIMQIMECCLGALHSSFPLKTWEITSKHWRVERCTLIEEQIHGNIATFCLFLQVAASTVEANISLMHVGPLHCTPFLLQTASASYNAQA